MNYKSYRFLPVTLALALALVGAACSHNPAPDVTASPATRPEANAILKTGEGYELTR